MPRYGTPFTGLLKKVVIFKSRVSLDTYIFSTGDSLALPEGITSIDLA